MLFFHDLLNKFFLSKRFRFCYLILFHIFWEAKFHLRIWDASLNEINYFKEIIIIWASIQVTIFLLCYYIFYENLLVIFALHIIRGFDRTFCFQINSFSPSPSRHHKIQSILFELFIHPQIRNF